MAEPVIVALDIETIPDPEKLGDAIAAGFDPESVKYGNAKDEGKRAEILARARESWETDLREKAQLSPRTGQVLSVSLWDGARQRGGVATLREFDMNEGQLLDAVFERFRDIDAIVTFNGFSFDLPFLKHRAVVKRTPIPRTWPTRRYGTWPHCDLRMILGDWDKFAPGNLQFWCREFGVPCPDKDMGIDPKHLGDLVEEGRWEEIEKYSLGGAQSAWNLYSVLLENGYLPPFDAGEAGRGKRAR